MTKYILGIDPGTTESGYAMIKQDYTINESGKIDNDAIIQTIKDFPTVIKCVVIESIQSYGMTMGKSTIETCYFIGRLIQVCKDLKVSYKLIPRPEYGKAIVGGNKVNDALMRSSLENRFGSYDKGRAEKKLKNGTVKQAAVPPGPLSKLSGTTDQRSAFAVAVYWIDVYGDK